MSDDERNDISIPDAEIEAIKVVLAALDTLQSTGPQVRVLNYVIRRTLPQYYDLSSRS
jgi:hypothetical protein